MLDCGVVPRIIPFGQQGTLTQSIPSVLRRRSSSKEQSLQLFTISHSGLRQTETHICGTEFHPIPPAGGFVNSVLPVGQMILACTYSITHRLEENENMPKKSL